MTTPSAAKHLAHVAGEPQELEMPAATAWPFVLAFGSTLLFAGLLTSLSVSVLGAALAAVGCVGWFREVLPQEHEETVSVLHVDSLITTRRPIVERVPIAPDQVRAWLPVQTYPVSAGVKGGWAGSVAMAVIACTYGLLKAGSIWYPINLLAASIYAQSVLLEPAQLYTFHASSVAAAIGLHGLVSTLVGLLYGAMLPMVPGRPILLGGAVAPVLWSGLLWSILGLLNPLLQSRIDWSWFIASQVAFGVVAGVVVARQTRMLTRENVPFALRAGVEAPGLMTSRDGGEIRR